MAIGKSHRIVIEIDPEMKSDIYAELKKRGLTLKEWFVSKAQEELLPVAKNKTTLEKR